MTRMCQDYTPQTQSWLGEEEAQNTNSHMTQKKTIKVNQPALSSSAKLLQN